MWIAEVAVDDDARLAAGDARRVLRRAAPMLRPYRRQIRAAGALLVLSTASVLAGPFFVRYGIDNGIAVGDESALWTAVAAYVLTAVASYVVIRAVFLLVGRAGEGFLRDLRERVFAHIQRLSMPFPSSAECRQIRPAGDAFVLVTGVAGSPETGKV